MGWNPFKSKKVTQVATQVTRAIADDALPNSVRQGAIRAFFEDGDLPEYLLEETIQSLAIKADRMYDYAGRAYVFGLPSGEAYVATQGKDEAQAILDTLEGAPVLLEYYRYGPPNNLHVGWIRLIEQHGYNPDTNILGGLTAQKGKNVYLTDLQVVIPFSQKDSYEQGALNQWGSPATAGYTPERLAQITSTLGNLAEHTPVLYSKLVTAEHVLASYIVDDPARKQFYDYESEKYTTETTYPRGTLTIQTSDVDDAADFFHAKYTVGNTTKYWMYEASTGTYPVLDALFNAPPTELGSFYPIAYFRHNKARVDLDKTSAEYKTSKKLVDYIGIDYQMMVDSIHENPDIADVEQAMLIMAVPANTDSEVERKYLFDFFDAQYYVQDSVPLKYYADNIFSRRNTSNQSSIVIQDKRSKFALNHRGIYKKRKVGTIGPVGTHSSEFGNIPVSEKYDVEDETRAFIKFTGTSETPCHYYRRQITEFMYDEIQVIDLKMVYNIWGGYNTVGDDLDDILLIPIDRNITKEYWIGEKEELYARSLHYVFNSRVITKVKWYQQGWFTTLLQIAAIVIMIYSLGTQGYEIYAAAAAAGYTAAQALLITILTLALQSYLIGAVFKLFVKTVGAELAFLVAVIAAAYGISEVIDAGSFAKAAPLAKDLLGVASGLVSAIGADIQAQIGDLMGEFSEFDKYVEEQTKLLDAANDLLKTSQVLSPFVIFGENPDDFYKRTVHSGNIGTIGIDAIGNYVERSLTLPQLSSTIGEFDNELQP